MCRKPALAATALALVMLASPALAWGGKKKDEAKPAKPAASAPAAPATGGTNLPAEDKAPLFKPTAAERAAAERMDPLGRAAFWSRVTDSDPRDIEGGIKLAKALRALGQYPQAAEAVQVVLVLQPDNYEALLEFARDQIGAGDAFFAIDPLAKAISINPKDWRPLSLQAIAYEQTLQPDMATQAFAKALVLAPDNPSLLTNHAIFLAGRGQTAQAEAQARRAAALPGAGPQERQNLALVLGLSGRLDEAEKLIRRDLPPAQAEANLAYLRSVAGPGQRSWNDVGKARQ